MFTQESITKELKRINDSVPQLFKDMTIIETKKTPAIEFVAQKLIEDPDISQEKKDKIKKLLDKGTFSKMKLTENVTIAKMRDEYVSREIKKSVKAGRLPTKKQFREMRLNELHNDK